jgi:hypothetical protein
MVAALAAGIALGIMNGFHISWGTGCAPLSKRIAYISNSGQATWRRLGSICDLGTNAKALVCLPNGVSLGALLRQSQHPRSVPSHLYSSQVPLHVVCCDRLGHYSYYRCVLHERKSTHDFNPRTYKTDHTRPSNAEVDPHKRGHPCSQRVAITCRRYISQRQPST